jgi:tol-pal system protein YbgF
VPASESTWRRRSRFAFALALSLAASPLLPLTGRAEEGESAGDRIGRLEAEIADLKVMVGTLQSLVQSRPGTLLPQEAGSGPPTGQALAGDADLAPRVEALETQIGALTNQMEQIGQQMTALEARVSAAPQTEPVPQASDVPGRQGDAMPQPTTGALASAAGDLSQPRWFGPRPGDEQQGVSAPPDPTGPQQLVPPSLAGDVPSGQTGNSQRLAAALPDGDTESLYQQGYGALLQQDYASAETSFRALIKSHPDDPLAINAQYWLGESYYAQGQYKSAAAAFLKSYKKNKSGEKAPSTLLKLAMSLAGLGQKDAACSTFGELSAKFPKAPEDIRDQAAAERKQAGC